jgi:uncharacterized protein YkwD
MTQDIPPNLEINMRRLARALVCVGGLAALTTPVATAQAGADHFHCRLTAAKPTATATLIRAAVTRTGCETRTQIRIQVMRADRGIDRVVRHTRKTIRNATLVTQARCTERPHTYYVMATDGHGHLVHSKPARLSCVGAPGDSGGTGGNGGSGGTGGSGGSGGSGSAVGSATEQEVVRLTNEARQGHCGALVNDAKLHAAALGHSRDMAAKNYFSHTSQDGRSFSARITAAGFNWHAVAENIAFGQRTPAEVVKTWLDSPGHRANIMNCTYTRIGVGVAQGAKGLYWTQDFGA